MTAYSWPLIPQLIGVAVVIAEIILLTLVAAVIVLLYSIGSAISLWVQALVSGGRAGLLDIIFRRFRQVPLASAEAFRQGNLGVMDYAITR